MAWTPNKKPLPHKICKVRRCKNLGAAWRVGARCGRQDKCAKHTDYAKRNARKTCRAYGCEKKRGATYGYCHMHKKRLVRHGCLDPQGIDPQPPTYEGRVIYKGTIGGDDE